MFQMEQKDVREQSLLQVKQTFLQMEQKMFANKFFYKYVTKGTNIVRE